MDDEKLKSLREKIDSAQDKLKPEIQPIENRADSMNKGMQILTEMIGIMIASGVLGYLLDSWLETAPAFLLSMLVLGMITFFYKLIKMTKKSEKNRT